MKATKMKQKIKQEIRENIICLYSEYEGMFKDILRQREINNPDVIAKFYDYEVDKLLETAYDRKQYCLKLIEEINHLFQYRIQPSKKAALQVLKENVLGKLFLFSLQDSKYLVIKDFTPIEQKNEILAELDILRSSEDKAILYLDMLERGAHRNFINGIISYLY